MSEHLGEEDVVGEARLAALLYSVEQLDVAHVAHADERLARNLQRHALNGLHGQEPPVVLRHSEARHLVGGGVVVELQVAVQACALGHVDGLHAHVVQAEYLRSFEAHHKPLQLLLVDGEVARLDGEHAVARETKHLLHLRVPSHAVGVLLLKQELLGDELVHHDVGVLVHHRQLPARGREVKAADAGRVLDELDRELVVDEDLEDEPALEAHQQALSARGASHHLDVADDALKQPLALLAAVKGEELQLLLLAEDDVQGGDHQQVAVQALLDLGAHAVVHVESVVVRQLVDDDAVRELHRQPVLVHRNLLDVVPALYAHLLFCDEVLDDDVRHEVAVGVALLVQAVHGAEDELVHADGAVLAPHRHVVLLGPRLHAPNPGVALGHGGEARSLLGDEPHLPVCASDADVLAVAEVRHRAGVEAHLFVLANLDAGELVKAEGSVPAPDRQDVVWLVPRRVPAQRPYGRVALNQHLLDARFVPDADASIELPQCQVHAVIGPRQRHNLGADFVLGNRFLLRAPEPKIRGGGARQLLRHGVVLQALDGFVVAVLEDALRLVSPDDDGLVRPPRRKPFAVAAVGHGVHCLFVAFERVQQVPVHGVVHKHPTPHARHQLRPVWLESDVVTYALDTVAVRHFIRPCNDSTHISC
mmetsp:Transcript_49321/g.91830  ORF Transcript_49321/g.91830 Transcript_49321/m.91830 type:complete len:648 (+) Transcript_49321:2089-4032(+)